MTQISKNEDEEKVDDAEETLGFFETPKIFRRYKYGTNRESTLIEFDGVNNCNNSIFIEGLRGIGITSTVVGAHIIGSLKLQCIAVFISPSLPAMASVHKFMPTSAIRIYGNKDVCVAIGDIALNSIERSDIIWQICQSLVDFAKRHHCKHIVSVDGFPVKGKVQKQIDKIAKLAKTSDTAPLDSMEKDEEKSKDPFESVHYLTNNKLIAEKLQKDGHEGIKTMQIMGVTGAMMQLAFCCDMYWNDDGNKENDIPFCVLLGPDPVQIPDRRGALLVIRLLKEIWNLNQINLETLQKEAQRLQEKVQQTVTEIATQMQQQTRLQMSKAAPPQHMYV